MKSLYKILFLALILASVQNLEARLFTKSEMDGHLDGVASYLYPALSHPAYKLVKFYSWILEDARNHERLGKYWQDYFSSLENVQSAKETGAKILADGYVWGINTERKANKEEAMYALDFVKSLVRIGEEEKLKSVLAETLHGEDEAALSPIHRSHLEALKDMVVVSNAAMGKSKDLPKNWQTPAFGFPSMHSDTFFDDLKVYWTANSLSSKESLEAATRLSRLFALAPGDDFIPMFRNFTNPFGLLFEVLNYYPPKREAAGGNEGDVEVVVAEAADDVPARIVAPPSDLRSPQPPERKDPNMILGDIQTYILHLDRQGESPRISTLERIRDDVRKAIEELGTQRIYYRLNASVAKPAYEILNSLHNSTKDYSEGKKSEDKFRGYLNLIKTALEKKLEATLAIPEDESTIMTTQLLLAYLDVAYKIAPHRSEAATGGGALGSRGLLRHDAPLSAAAGAAAPLSSSRESPDWGEAAAAAAAPPSASASRPARVSGGAFRPQGAGHLSEFAAASSSRISAAAVPGPRRSSDGLEVAAQRMSEDIYEGFRSFNPTSKQINSETDKEKVLGQLSELKTQVFRYLTEHGAPITVNKEKLRFDTRVLLDRLEEEAIRALHDPKSRLTYSLKDVIEVNQRILVSAKAEMLRDHPELTDKIAISYAMILDFIEATEKVILAERARRDDLLG